MCVPGLLGVTSCRPSAALDQALPLEHERCRCCREALQISLTDNFFQPPDPRMRALDTHRVKPQQPRSTCQSLQGKVRGELTACSEAHPEIGGETIVRATWVSQNALSGRIWLLQQGEQFERAPDLAIQENQKHSSDTTSKHCKCRRG